VPRCGWIVFLTVAARLVGGLLPDPGEDWWRGGPVIFAAELANLTTTVFLALGALLPLVDKPQP